MKKIIINGGYDLLHIGHLNLINYAKSLGDYLIVALDTDERISENKGKERPINNLKTRIAIMQNLKAVNEVREFGSDDELIRIFKDKMPDIRVIGSDWKGKEIIGETYCKEIIYYERTDDNSTTNTIEGYVDRRFVL